MGVIGIHHVSMKCSEKEYEAAVSFYKNDLGLRVFKQWETGILLDTGNGYIEIFNDGEVLPKGVIGHFALEVKNLQELVDSLKKKNVDFFIEPKEINLAGLKAQIAFCFGPLGEQIEFFEVLE